MGQDIVPGREQPAAPFAHPPTTAATGAVSAGRLIAVSNLKGGTGKSTTALNLIVGLMRKGRGLATVDLDTDQEALSRYLENRRRFAEAAKLKIGSPQHFRFTQLVPHEDGTDLLTKVEPLASLLDRLLADNELVVVDCPSGDNPLIRHVLSRADMLISPVNESFVDLDVLGEVRGSPPKVTRIGRFAKVIRDEIDRRDRDDLAPLDWIVVRNRRNPSASRNTAAVSTVLRELQKALPFRPVDGFVDRLIFRELFLVGLSILDLRKEEPLIAQNPSHKAAYDETVALIDKIGLLDLAPMRSGPSAAASSDESLVASDLVRNRRTPNGNGAAGEPSATEPDMEAKAPPKAKSSEKAAGDRPDTIKTKAPGSEPAELKAIAATKSVDSAETQASLLSPEPQSDAKPDSTVPNDVAARPKQTGTSAAPQPNGSTNGLAAPPTAPIGEARPKDVEPGSTEGSDAKSANGTEAGALATERPVPVTLPKPGPQSDDDEDAAANGALGTPTPVQAAQVQRRLATTESIKLEPGDSTARNRVLVIFDAAGGRRHRQNFRATLQRLAHLGCNVTVHECRGPDDARAYMRETISGAFDAVFVAGGDPCILGTAHHLAATDLPVAIASPRTDCRLATELGLPNSPKGIAQVIVDGETEQRWLGEANDQAFIGAAAIGSAADLLYGSRRSKAKESDDSEASEHGGTGFRLVVNGRYRDVAGAFFINAQFLPREFVSVPGAVRGERKLFAVMLEHSGWRARMQYKTALMTGRIGTAKGVVVEEATQISVWGSPGEALWSEGHAICALPAQVRLMRHPVKLIS